MATSRSLAIILAAFLWLVQVLATNHFVGIAASNSIGGTSTFTCRTQQQWNDLANTAKANGFRSIRIIGFDCNALDWASSAAQAAGLTILAGIYYTGSVASSRTSINNDVKTFLAACAKYGTGRYAGLTVGNEIYSDTLNNVIAEVDDVRNQLRAAGVQTPVSTSHTWVMIRDNPTILCRTDFVAANAHAFYDTNTVAAEAGDFVFKIVVPALQHACPGKQITITECGWPSRGSTNGVAVPSIPNERSALASLNCACRDDTSISVYAFEYDDQGWKANDNERSFGIDGKLNFGDIFASC